jgi:hypothetical protein
MRLDGTEERFVSLQSAMYSITVPIYDYCTQTCYKFSPHCWNSITVDYVLSIVKLSIKYDEQLPTLLCKTMKGTFKVLVFSGKIRPITGHEGPEVE